jgi:hypothetical protein
MKVEQPNPYGALEEGALGAFERSLKERLPETYRQHLLSYNGGKWEPKCFVISEKEGESSVHGVYGLHGGPGYCRLDAIRETFSDRIPKDLLAIACDSFGNQICIGISGKWRDAIYFWNHEVVGNKSLTRIADSFDNFIGSLFKYEPTEHLSKIIEDNDLDELKRLLDDHLIELEGVDQYGRTLIERSAIAARPEIIEFLFDRGAKLRDALAYAEKNAEYFSEHIPVVELIKQLARRVN